MKLIGKFSERGFRARFLLSITVLIVVLWGSEVSATSVNVGDTVYFIRNSAELSPEGQETLQRQAAWLMDHPTVICALEGHTDAWGDREWNIKLGKRRAETVRTFLLGLGIAGRRLTIISYGEDRPGCLGMMEQCWSYNRRVTTIVTGGYR